MPGAVSVETALDCDHKQLGGIRSDAVDSNVVRCLPGMSGEGLAGKALLEAPH